MAVSAIGFCEIFIHPLCATGEFGSLLQNSPVAHRGCIKIQNPIALTAIIGMMSCLVVGDGGNSGTAVASQGAMATEGGSSVATRS